MAVLHKYTSEFKEITPGRGNANLTRDAQVTPRTEVNGVLKHGTK
jgi:hypothetical protein